jgi:hypothetical protein
LRACRMSDTWPRKAHKNAKQSDAGSAGAVVEGR